jgi:transcriptional antiterminator RfaH
MLRWYLIHTKPSGETLAESNLERQGYEVYVPRVAQPVRQSGRWQERIGALFPRYLFLRLDEGRQPIGPVHSTVGVTAVVRFGSAYAIVPDQVIRDLRSRADPESGLHRLNRTPLFTPGTAVKIAKGTFEGLEGVFQTAVGSERVVVLLKLLGQSTSVRISVDLVLPSLAV